jgi:hypothetical protein
MVAMLAMTIRPAVAAVDNVHESMFFDAMAELVT